MLVRDDRLPYQHGHAALRLAAVRLGALDELQLARRYYNGTVRDLNTRIEVFPSNLIARQFGFAKADFFELENVAEREVPKVEF